MLLHYIYIKEYACLKDAKIHFSGKYRFRYSPKCGHLVVDPGCPLSEGFFGLSCDRKSKVESVSVVVGANGAGKTSIAKFLRDLYLPYNNITDFVLFVEIDGVNHCYYKFSASDGHQEFRIFGLKDVKTHEWTPRNMAIDCIRNKIQFVYLTPHYTIDHSFANDGDALIDLSTRGLLASRPEYYANQEHGIRANVSESLVFQNEQTEWMLLFAKALKEMVTVGVRREQSRWNYMSIPIPKGIRISINRIGQEVNRVHFANKDGGVRGGAADYNDIRAIVNSDAESFIGNLFLIFAGNYWKDTGVREDVPNWERSFGKALLRFCRMPFERTVDGMRVHLREWFSLDNILRFFDNPGEYIGTQYCDTRGVREHLSKVRYLFRLLAQIKVTANNVVISNAHTMYISFDDEGSYDYVLDIIHAHRESCLITSMLQFEFQPCLSAGEMSTMSIWGRLYWQFVMQRKGVASTPMFTNIMLFIDEAETTMHPSWQRKLVRTMILFFERFVPDVNVQLIFSTHSPLLLSDIPMDNVCCLRRKRNGDTGANSLKHSGIINTFAASIADLYLIPYFMNEGTTGEFATKKVNRLLSKASHSRNDSLSALSDEDKEIQRLVGNRMVREYIARKIGWETR